MASSLFKDYSFRTGKLTVTKGERLNILLPICAKKKDIVLLIRQCSINGVNGSESVITPRNNEIQLRAGKRKAFKFDFPRSEISDYSVGATISVEIWEQTEKLCIRICYRYENSKSGWVIESVVDETIQMSDEVEEGVWDVLLADEDLDLKEDIIVDLAELGFPTRTYYVLKRAGFHTLNDITKVTLGELSKIRGMRPDDLIQVLTALREYSLWLAKEHIDADAEGTIGDKKVDEEKASADKTTEKITNMSASNIKPGCRIIHEKFGEGLVISVGDQVDVQFPSIPKIQLRTAWVEANCRIITPGEEKAAFQKEMLHFVNAMEKVAEKKLADVVAGFKKFSLSERGLNEIERFFRFKIGYADGHKKALRYNLLIQCDNDDESLRVLKKIESGLKKIGALPKKTLIKTEFQLNEKLPSEYPLECSMLGIYNCRPILRDSVGIVSSGIRSTLQLEKKKKDLVWEFITKSGYIDPDCTVVAIGPKGFVDYIKENDDWYYRFFAHRVLIHPMSTEEIIKALYNGIEQEKLIATKEFQTEIERYIRVVYPKADLKDASFVDDCLNRIFVNYYIAPNASRKLSVDHVPFYRKPKSFEEISEQLNQLIGLSKVKQQFKNIYRLSQDSMAINKQRLHFAFVGNPGTGKTTVARFTADLLFAMGLIKRNKLVAVAPTDIISVYRGESAQLLQEKIEEASGGVLFIDEAYFLTSKTSDPSSPQKQCLDLLIQVMENRSDELTIIFAGYSNEIEEMMKSNPGIASRVPYKFVFEDYSNEELLQIFNNLAAQEGMTLEKKAYDLMLDRIALAKTEENFGNARTIANIYQQLKAIWLEQNRTERIITAEDVRASMPVALNADLDKMIGLTSVKKELKDFEARVKYIKFLRDKNVTVPAPNMHMMFTGNPGTGKTTVARKIADCLYQIGVLKTNKLVVAERKELVGQYVGETAPKTSALINKAMNGVLFIDEAYSLYRPDAPRDAGTEAIATLITAMENNKDCLVVIFAGYRKEMQVFQSANPGITSRIGFTFDFPDYTPDELTQMFYMKMRRSGFMLDEIALGCVHKVMEYFSKMEDFGNGRFVDKVIDMTINNRAQRTYAQKYYNDIMEKDIPEIKDIIMISSKGQSLWTDEEQSDSMRRRIAIHEVGHAVVSRIACPERKIATLSINADAASIGRAVIETDSNNLTETSLKGQLAVYFAGRNAERLILGEHSAGCAADISQAKRLAEYMIEQLAMGEFGVTTVTDLLKEADQKSTEILTMYKDSLLKIVERLYKQGTISGDDLVLKETETC